MDNYKQLEKKLLEYECKNLSAWNRGLSLYAWELLEILKEGIEGKYFHDDDIIAPKILQKELLNGAYNWIEYSEGGCSLIYDRDICVRLCTPSMILQKDYGRLDPNSRETWIELQARALYQASRLILKWAREIE